MKRNIGKTDSAIRIVLALIIALFVAKGASGTATLILTAVAAVFALTSILRFCPLYSLFRLSTLKK